MTSRTFIGERSTSLAEHDSDSHDNICTKLKSALKDRSIGLEQRKNTGNIDMQRGKRSDEKIVSFSIVDVRDYSLCLGDNPSVSRGAPISLDWGYNDEQSYDIDIYEDDRCENRREPEELRLPSLERIQLLKGLGYSRGEINEQTKLTHEAKLKRFVTRRRVEREDRFKAFVRGVVKNLGKAISTPNPKKSKNWPYDTTVESHDRTFPPESEEDTLASSTSSKKSDISAIEDCRICLSCHKRLSWGFWISQGGKGKLTITFEQHFTSCYCYVDSRECVWSIGKLIQRSEFVNIYLEETLNSLPTTFHMFITAYICHLKEL